MSGLLRDLLSTSLGRYLELYIRSKGHRLEDVVRLRLSCQVLITGVAPDGWAICESGSYIMATVIFDDGSAVVHAFNKAETEQAVR